MLICKNIPKALGIARFGHSTPIMYQDDFNKAVDRFFTNFYRVIDGEGRFK